MRKHTSLRSRRPVLVVASVLLAYLAGSATTYAESRRARLSRDLADRLTSRLEAPTDVIVTASDTAIDQLAIRYGVRVKKRIHGGAVMEVTGGQLDALSLDADVPHIAGDVSVQRMMAVTTQSTGADQAWAGFEGLRGVTGRGIGVAIIDSGIAPHLALTGRVIASVDFTGPTGTGRDEYGHGTHVAAIVAENGDGHTGMAPGANLINLRVLGADGSGRTSDVIAAIDWAIAHRQQFNIRVINLSLGHPVFESYRDDPLCQAAQRAIDAGMIVIAAAGNFGKTADGRPVVGGIVAPGNTPDVITVGAINTRGTPQRSDDVMATYSSRGPTAIDAVLKPELVAPGNRIVAASAAGSYLARTYPERVVEGTGTRAYIELSGTSMATAVVSGAAALLLEARPTLTPAQVKFALQLTSSRLPDAGLIEEGAGSLNALAAVELVNARLSVRELATTTIANERITSAAFAFAPTQSGVSDAVWADILVWGNNCILVWGNTTFYLAPNSLVTGNILVWGNQSILASILVWGNSVQADILVWGNVVVWTSSVSADILVWGNRTEGDILVWGD